MSRINKLDPSEWDEDLRKLTQVDEATPLEQGLMRMFAHKAELAKGLAMFAGALKIHRSLPDRLIELVRLRVAYHNQCKSCSKGVASSSCVNLRNSSSHSLGSNLLILAILLSNFVDALTQAIKFYTMTPMGSLYRWCNTPRYFLTVLLQPYSNKYDSSTKDQVG